MISVNAVSKRFTRERLALNDVSFTVGRGEIVGLLGHNGAGKSTMLGIMLDMVRPDMGEVLVDGNSVQKHRAAALRQIGAIFEAPSFYEYMSGWHNLKCLCALSGWWDEKVVWQTLEMVKLADRIHGKVRTYSHGMRQRLALAQALLPMPKVLLLDEPTDGLDPEGIHEFRSTILNLREHGLTILFNSHLLAEVELMCDRCVVLNQGRKIYEGSVKDRGHERPRFLLQTEDLPLAISIATQMRVTAIADGEFEIPESVGGPDLLAAFVRGGVRVHSWQPVHKTLEDWYLDLSTSSHQLKPQKHSHS